MAVSPGGNLLDDQLGAIGPGALGRQLETEIQSVRHHRAQRSDRDRYAVYSPACRMVTCSADDSLCNCQLMHEISRFLGYSSISQRRPTEHTPAASPRNRREDLTGSPPMLDGRHRPGSDTAIAPILRTANSGSPSTAPGRPLSQRPSQVRNPRTVYSKPDSARRTLANAPAGPSNTSGPDSPRRGRGCLCPPVDFGRTLGRGGPSAEQGKEVARHAAACEHRIGQLA